MELSTFKKDNTFNRERITTSIILESPFSKEIRIMMAKGLEMKKHQTAYPIVVHVLSGKINFGVEDESYELARDGILCLEGNIPHNLFALEDSIIRLTLSKLDKAERVAKVAR